MLWRETATLIQEGAEPDGEGYRSTVEQVRTVFVDKASVTRSEFYAAKQAGDAITLVLRIRGADYKGETMVNFQGKTYDVVRTYTKGGEIYQLNCKESSPREVPQ